MSLPAAIERGTGSESDVLSRYVEAIARLGQARKALRRARGPERRRAARHALEEAETLCRRSRLEARERLGLYGSPGHP